MTTTPTLTLERTFHATPEKLWSYWTEPKKYARWLNPAPIDLVIHEFDVRVGGKIRFDMPQPDGSLNPQEGVFHTLEPYTLLVSGSADRSFLLTARFTPVAEGTRLNVEVKGVPPEWHAAATVGWGQGLDKLDADLAAPEGGFSLIREFKAAPEKVWNMWTTKEGIEKWWAPGARDIGYEMHVRRMDVRVGGGFALEMTNKQHTITNHSTYTRVDPHVDLAWTWHFDIYLGPDEKPYDVPITLHLQKTAAGGTKMRFVQGPLATPQFSEGSRAGVMNNFVHLAKALDG